MLEICLLVLPWMADSANAVDPVTPVRPVVQTDLSTATCVRPTASTVDIPVHSATNQPRAASCRTAGEWIERWETAVRHVPYRNRSQREEFRRQVRERFNEHVGDAADQLIGRVRADQLIESFRWQIVETNREHVQLEAIPRDEIERLFIGSLQIRLDIHTGVPDELAVVSRGQRSHTVWSSKHHQSGQIDLANFEDSVPPPPVVVLRTADVRVE